MNIFYIVLVRVPGHVWREHTKPIVSKAAAESIARGVMDASPEIEVKIVQHFEKPKVRKGRRG